MFITWVLIRTESAKLIDIIRLRFFWSLKWQSILYQYTSNLKKTGTVLAFMILYVVLPFSKYSRSHRGSKGWGYGTGCYPVVRGYVGYKKV
jgi:hypothetical protein